MNQPAHDDIFSLYPWNRSIWDWLRTQFHESTHAWLLSGQRGVGRHQVALALAAELLSTDQRNQDLLKSGSHPDLHVLMPEIRAQDDFLSLYARRYFDKQSTGKPKTVITVDQVRELIQKMSTHAHSGGHKVVIITPAETMNLNAANALLKVLEEPPAATLFVLVSERSNLLPATVRSRTSQVKFPTPTTEQGANWLRKQLGERDDLELLLKLADGAPLIAMHFAQSGSSDVRLQVNEGLEKLWRQDADPLALAAHWQKLGADQVLPWLLRVVCDLVRGAMCQEEGARFNPYQLSWITDIEKNIDITRAYKLYDRLGNALIDLDGPLDKHLLLEDLALAFRGLKTAA